VAGLFADAVDVAVAFAEPPKAANWEVPMPLPPEALLDALAAPAVIEVVAVDVAFPPLPPLSTVPPLPPEALLNALPAPVVIEVVAVDVALPPFPPFVPAPPAPP
jgi:hypothetical protein